MKTGITGAGGFLGSRLVEYFGRKEKETGEICVVPYTREKLDFTSREQVFKVLKKDCPDVLIHTAAISDISACSADPELSEKVNVTGVRYISDACAEYGIRLIFCSSDQVYMGSPVKEPHREDEKDLNPPSLYAKQKLRAEEYILSACKDAVILRLSWMFGADYEGRREHGNLLSNLALTVREEKKPVFPVYDFRSITDVWEVVKNMEKMFTILPGIYNFGSENDQSTYDLVSGFMERLGLNEFLPEKNMEAFAGNPRNLRMNMDKCRKAGIVFERADKALGKMIRRWRDAGFARTDCSGNRISI